MEPGRSHPFLPRPIGILHQVSAAGGAPIPVTSLDELAAEIAHAFPHFLPGGRQFLYLAASFASGRVFHSRRFARFNQF